MKTTILLAIGLAVGGTTMAQSTNPATLRAPRKTKYDPQVYEVTNNGINMSVSYWDLAECAAKLEKDASLNRWSEAQRAEEAAKTPPGGYLKATWSRNSPLLASADNFVFLVEAPDGREIVRYKPQPSLPSPFSVLGVTVYTDLMLVALPEPLQDGARVYVIEASAHKRYDYIVHP